MDKFTVDLEKVLDEFEYSEGREEVVVSPAPRNPSYPRNSPKQGRLPPAAPYRRPPFEPINLADADFSADPASVNNRIINVAKSFTEHKFAHVENNSAYPQCQAPIATNENFKSFIKTELDLENVSVDESVGDSSKLGEETPDLLDSNSLKSSQNCPDQEIDLDKPRLPDITSVHSCSEPEEDIKTVDELDLIKRDPIVETAETDDLPPIVGLSTLIKTDLPDLQVTPLTFDSVEIPDSDLVSYLDSLDIDSSAISSISDNITDSGANSLSHSESIAIENETDPKVNDLENAKPEIVNVQVSSDLNSDEAIKSTLVCSEAEASSVVNLTPKEIVDSKITSDIGNHVSSEQPGNEDGPPSFSSDFDDKEIRALSNSELDTKQKYSICPDICDDFSDVPEEPICVPKLSETIDTNYIVSDIDNGNVTAELNLNENSCDQVNPDEAEQEQLRPQELNLNSIKETSVDNQISEIKEVTCDSACKSLQSNIVSQSTDNQINKIIIRVPSETGENSSAESISEHGADQRLTLDSPDQIEINNALNDSINQAIQSGSVNRPNIVEGFTNYGSDNSEFNSVACVPSELSTQAFTSEQSKECLDNTLNSNSDDLSRSLHSTETEREEIDNRDNEEKAELGLDSENNEGTSGNAPELFYSGDSSDANSGEADMKPSRPSTLPLPHSHILTDSEESPTPSNSSSPSVGGIMSPEERSLGKQPPYWVPDTESDCCMLCNAKFTVIKRRHHCRACGLVLCSKCCNLKAPLEYMGFAEARVCQPCFNIIYRVGLDEGRYNRGRQPNPNNPMEYCSTVPPLQQVSAASASAPPAVFVPTSVLKREGRARSDTPKQVMFSDGIRPGGDLTELDGSGEAPRHPPRRSSLVRKMHSSSYRSNNNNVAVGSEQREKRPLDPATQSFIPASGNLPPMVTVAHGNITFLPEQLTSVSSEPVKFAINYNLFINVKRVKLSCCVNREVWSVCSEGLCLVGQDEVALVLETLPEETLPHVDIFHLVNYLWKQAALGSTASEMCFTAWFSNSLLGSSDHGGFLYIRPSLQCTTNLLLPAQPYLFALLVHRWETGWARLFPLRLVLRLGAEYRYYPSPLVSIRNRQPLYTDIGHTIMKILADFRKFSYSLATVRGMVIHLEDKQTTILFPRNRYDQVTRALNNSNESVLAFGANWSMAADSHLVCIQGAKEENTYHTEAINIHNRPRKVTGASFVVFNGALKGSGDSGKSSILEDGLMVHLTPDRMAALRSALRSMHDFSLPCGPEQDETVLIHWTNDDTNFNVGVVSCIDGQALDGVPSIRVHNGTDYTAHSRLIRWTEVFILQCEEGVGEPVDVSRVSESVSRATCSALIPLLDSLAQGDFNPLAIRATIHQDNVGYEAGSRGEKLPTQYMRRLDDELVPVLHQAAMSQPSQSPVVLELVFRIMLMP